MHLWSTFVELIVTPFHHPGLIWGIVPLYFAWLCNELTSSKTSYRTALQTGFSFLWAGAQWGWQYLHARPATAPQITLDALPAINVLVTLGVLVLGVLAFVSGLRRRYPRGCSFLGHTRFSNYFMIAIYPIQAHYLGWTTGRLLAILVFAVPLWLVLHFGLMPVRRS